MRLFSFALLTASFGLVAAACGTGAPATPSASSPPAAPSPSPVHTGNPDAVFDVTTFGARGDGLTNDTAAFAAAIGAADLAGGGTVYVPAGRYVFGKPALLNQASIIIAGTVPVTLRGAGRDVTSLIETVPHKGLLSVRTDGTAVEDVTLDTQTNDGGAAIFVQANNTLLEHARVLGGAHAFAIYYAGPSGARRSAPTYNVGNVVNDLDLNDEICDDGFSWSFQEDSSISDVNHVGSRLALYADRATTVTDYTYQPGAQSCGARNGFWLTPPADDITITNFVSSGNGGLIGVLGGGGAVTVAANVTVRGLRMTRPGYRLVIGDVQNLLLSDCNLGSSTILIAARAVAEGSLANCVFGKLVRQSGPRVAVAITVRTT